MPAVPSSPIQPVLGDLAAAADHHQLAGAELMGVLAGVADPRARRGVRHPMTTILAVAVSAVLAGARSFTAIGEWAEGTSRQVLSALGVEGCPPCESAIRRGLQRLDGDELDAAIGGWVAGRTIQQQPGIRRALALDGKTVCGSAGTDDPARHLMAAIDHHTAAVVGQVNVDGKSNEISMFSSLCDQIDDLNGVVVTADAMHCQKTHADYLVLERGAHYILTVKANQPGLRHQLAALPWKDVPIGHTATSRSHGRIAQRSLKVVSVARGIVFPHATQAIQITRKTRKITDTKWRTEVVYAVTSLPPGQAGDADLAAWIRSHWCVENRLHWVRDVTFDEDRSQVRTGNGPRVMSSLRNLAISVLRLAGASNIARALRQHAWDPLKPVTLLLTT